MIILVMTMGMYRWLYGLLAACHLWTHVVSICTFPEDWRGRWFQGERGEIVIKESTISTSGVCKENERDYYLLEDREAGCSRCLLMMMRHRNIIQYKEGYCVKGKDNLRDVCGQLKVEDVLLTIVREPSLPIKCPFQDAYFFSYSNNSQGWCSEPQSSIRPCAVESKFNFHFKHCENTWDTYNKDLKFECFATWKDGSDTYIYGGFAGPGILRKDDMFRCFKYQTLGSDIHLAMSADSSCRGLRTPTDGPVVMKFTRDMEGWPSLECKFPAWMEGLSWRDLSGKHTFGVDESGEILRLEYQRKPAARPHTQVAYRCLQQWSDRSNPTEFVAMTLTSHGCTTTRQCLRIIRRHENVLEIQQGKAPDGNPDKCTERDFEAEDGTRHVVISETIRSEPCPLPGKYTMDVSEMEGDCHNHFHIGCNGTSLMAIRGTCASVPGGVLECVTTWKELDRRFVIARRIGADMAKVSNCFVFENHADRIHFYTDSDCNVGAPHVFNDAVKYTFKVPAASCEDTSYEIYGGSGARSRDGRGGVSGGLSGNAPSLHCATVWTLAAALLLCLQLLQHSSLYSR